MDHNDIRHKLSEYIDGAVTADEKTSIEAHLSSCAECGDALRELRRTIEHVREVEEAEPPAWLAGRIMARVREESARKSVLHTVLDHFALLRPLRVAAVLFLVVVVYSVYMAVPVRENLERISQEVAQVQEAPTAEPPERVRKNAVAPAPEKDVEQKPAYRSLDMRYSYEKPAPPEPAAPPAPDSSPPLTPQAQRSAAPQEQSEPALRDKLESKAGGRSALPAQTAPLRRAASREEELPADEGLQASADRDAGQDLYEQKRVIDHFMAHDLPSGMEGREAAFSTQKIGQASPELHGLDDALKQRVRRCGKTYLVEARRPGREMRFIYCYGTHIDLLGTYLYRDNGWKKVK